jgi:Mg2+-importing ATPase
MICKGAVEEMLNICTRAFDRGDDRQLQTETDDIIAMG